MSLQSIASATILLLPFTRFDFASHLWKGNSLGRSECKNTHQEKSSAYQPHGLGLDRFSSASPRFRRILATSIHPRKAYPGSLEATSCTWQHKWKCLATNNGKARLGWFTSKSIGDISTKPWKISSYSGPRSWEETKKIPGNVGE